MQIDFLKYQGTGNDFILIDNRLLFFPKENTHLVHQFCDRKFGIGADGLMLLENASGYDFKMVYYNADGNESTMCGNGGRCIAAFATHLGITQKLGKFIAIDGEHDFIIENNSVRLKMIDVPAIYKDDITKDFVLFTGSPHYVRFESDIENIDLVSEAKKIRYNKVYAKEGINVNFVEVNDGGIKMRTYERGVEDETLSCGTGTVAVALSYAVRQQINKGKIDISTPGGHLAVSFELKEDIFTDIWLEGPASYVFKGTFSI